MPGPLSLEGAFIGVALLSAVWTAFAIGKVGGPVPAALATAAVLVPGVLAEDPALPLSFAVVAALVLLWHRQGKVSRASFSGLPLQVLFVIAGYLAYITGRVLVRGGRAEAISNAREIVHLERALGLWVEPGIQDALNHGAIIETLNQVYLFAYYPIPAVALLVFFLRDRPGYVILRNSLAISAAFALVAIALYPVAPPRLVPGLGIIDTLEVGGSARAFANQYAAVPSLHVGWLSLVGLMMAVRGNRWMRWLAPIPPALMATTVVATGNHYWIDFVIGSAFAAGPAMVMLAMAQSRTEGESTEPVRAQG